MQSPIYNSKIPVVVASVCPEAHKLLQPILDQWFGESHHAIAIDEAADSAELMRSVTRGSGKWKKSLQCISAVFDQRVSMGLPECLPADHQLVLFVGDPFGLVVSEYQRQLGQPNYWHRGQRIEFSERFPTLQSFVERYPDWLYSRLPQDLTLANVQQKMRQEYLFVGVLESFQESVNQLATILGQPAVELAGVLDARTASGATSFRQKFYAQYPRLKAIYDCACESDEAVADISESSTDAHAGSSGPPRPHRGKITTGSLDLQSASSAD